MQGQHTSPCSRPRQGARPAPSAGGNVARGVLEEIRKASRETRHSSRASGGGRGPPQRARCARVSQAEPPCVCRGVVVQA